MILEGKYTGPLARVTVPGFQHRMAERGEKVKMRIPEGRPLGADWEIVKGKKEYEVGLKKVQDKLEADAKAKAAKKAEAKEKELKMHDKIVESVEKNQPDKKAGK